MTAYGDRNYRALKARLTVVAVECWHGCGRRATVPDHVPALAEHDHQPNGDCCRLLPSCSPCNLNAGARLGNRRRRERAGAARLSPGSDRWKGRP